MKQFEKSIEENNHVLEKKKGRDQTGLNKSDHIWKYPLQWKIPERQTSNI